VCLQERLFLIAAHGQDAFLLGVTQALAALFAGQQQAMESLDK